MSGRSDEARRSEGPRPSDGRRRSGGTQRSGSDRRFGEDRTASEPRPADGARQFSPLDDGLAKLGLEIGQIVRYRGVTDRRFHEAVVLRREDDGSIGLRDERGRARAITIDNIEVQVEGPRGGMRWVPLTEAGGGLQLGLF